MKFAFGTLVCLAAALIPAAQASVDITFTSSKFSRRDVAEVAQVQPNPEFGILLANVYLKHGGKGLPAPKDVKTTYPDCKWRHYNRTYGWMDENNVQCYLSPSYKYHAYSSSIAFKVGPSLERGACADTPNTDKYPENPRYSISVPYLYMNNLYDRRCKVRAMVKVPKTDEHVEYWVQAWVVEHDIGSTNLDGKVVPNGPQEGIMVDTGLYPKFFDKAEQDPSYGKTIPEVEWFFLDINTMGAGLGPGQKECKSDKTVSASSL
ncbi:hypothetical protein EX895_003900 [Sporisorium graminicola]|uniref:Uncharacterized protein n=1 Tax=Sporisorium graminicola TaxID=280036 RepID=A0A4U7KS64_9BASI|nr:hypothetical protein EX895_003900 [Sporisorium graminicola]TKY87223.1 hypothetical protein EX895_003900 [Sporisorium graminicola]